MDRCIATCVNGHRCTLGAVGWGRPRMCRIHIKKAQARGLAQIGRTGGNAKWDYSDPLVARHVDYISKTVAARGAELRRDVPWLTLEERRYLCGLLGAMVLRGDLAHSSIAKRIIAKLDRDG